jgi:hypothetical protein
MGAWTSAFMIGVTLAFNLLIRLAYPKDFPINLFAILFSSEIALHR